MTFRGTSLIQKALLNSLSDDIEYSISQNDDTQVIIYCRQYLRSLNAAEPQNSFTKLFCFNSNKFIYSINRL